MSAEVPGKVDGWRMVATGREFKGRLPLAGMARLGDLLFDAEGVADWAAGFGRDELELPYVDVRVDARLPLQCQRTLQRFEHPVQVRQRYGLVRDEDGEAALPKMALDTNGVPVVAWVEVDSGIRRLLVAKAAGDRFRFQGTAAIANLPDPASHLSLTLDGDDFPVVAVATQDATTLRRFNGSPTLPHGLTARSEASACNIPEDGDDFPKTLKETGCYADIQRGQLVADAVPFNINSPLWSDTAHKRRFAVLPHEKNIEYRETGTLGFPTGTILIKEFQIERTTGMPQSLTTMETRFLVKRCDFADDGCAESWQGYSYMWNDAGTSATLLEADATKLWDVTTEGVPRKHEHIYPSRDECTQCHVNAKGGALGPQAPQLNRPELYGDIIENQLSAWTYAGFFGDTGPSAAPESLAVIPSPADVGRSLEERTAGYFHANCGHCHQPEGQRPTPDLTYFGPGLDALVCVDATSTTKLPGKYIVPGDHTQSVIFLRDEARDGAAGIQMPPIASLLPDVRQLEVTQAYIDSLQGTCP